MKFMIGLPTITGLYDINVIKTIIDQLAFINSGHHAVTCNVVHNTLVHCARNEIAEKAAENGFDYVFFVDSDCVIPPNALERLVAHDKDIVAGMYFRKTHPYAPVVYKENAHGSYDVILDYPKDQLIEVDGIGMGVCLIKTSVFKKIEHPFDALAATDDHPAINGEDLAFCKRAKSAGVKIHVDTGIQALHQTTRYISEEYYLKTMQILKEQNHGNERPTTGD